MTEITGAPVRPRRNRRVFVLLGILVLLVAYVGCDAWAGHRVDAEVARFEKLYGTLSQSSQATVPAADNRARVVRAAAAMTALSAGTTFTEFSAAFSRFANRPIPVPVPNDLRAFVEANQEAIRLADTIRNRHRSNFEVDYPSGNNQAPLLDIRTLSSAIYLAAVLDLEAGRADDASRKITSGLAVSASLGEEPELIAQLIRIAVATTQFQAVQRVITEAQPSKAALADLARALAEDRTPDPMRIGLLGELRHVNTTLFVAGEGRPFPWVGPIARLGRPWIRLARVRYLEQMGRLLDIQSGPRPRPASSGIAQPPPWAFLERLAAISLPGLERSIETGDDFLSELGVTEVAVALRRYKARSRGVSR